MTREARASLLRWFAAALQAVDSRRCVARALCDRAVPPGDVDVIAVGKCAGPMAAGARDALGARIRRELVVTSRASAGEALRLLPGADVVASAHPVPDASSLIAGTRLTDRASDALAGAWPLLLVSGGASSLAEVLHPGVTLDDLVVANRRLLASGVPIAQLNAERRRLSALKGGGLSRRLGAREAVALFVSDVPHDDPGVIGSGLLAPVSGDRIHRYVVASVEAAMQAAAVAARAEGLAVAVHATRLAGTAESAGRTCAEHLQDASPAVHVWGGETTMVLPREPGRGGRNQHLALAAAEALDGLPHRWLLAAGTDGIDGVTEDAGAIIDGGTWMRVLDAGIDPAACLGSADSSRALEAAGDLLHTGPTATNVGDLAIGLCLNR